MKTSIRTITTETNDIPEFISDSRLSVTIWFTGCEHNCKDCHNKQLQQQCKGLILNEIKEILEQRKDLISWIVLMGGDPLYSNNIYQTKILIEIAKELEYKIMIYTGYEYNEIEKLDVDYIKTGRYIKNKYNKDYHFYSTNQKIYNKEGQCVYYYDENNNKIINLLK